MDWLTKFFAAFDGPAWTTLFISAGAVVVSVVALVRTRVPKPHWESLGVVEEQNESDEPAYTDALGDAIYPMESVWSAHIRQNGPGAAESVATSIRLPNGDWLPEVRFSNDPVGRGAELGLILCAREKVAGEYRVRVTYRQLPNTRKPHTWVHEVRLD